MEFFVGTQHLHGVVGRTEGIHQGERKFYAQTSAGGKHLTDDDVDETHLARLMATYGQQRLGAIQAHGGAKTAVQLQESGLCKGVDRLVMVDGLVHIMETWHAGKWLDLFLTNPTAGLLVPPDLV